MYLFSKKYERTIQIDLLRKTNVLNYQKVCFKKGDHLSIGSHQGARSSLVNKAFVLEVLSLKKAFFKFEENKTHKRKKTYVSTNTRVFLKNKVFLYNFSKNTISLLKNLQNFYLENLANKIHVEADALLPSNLRTSTQNFSEFLLEVSVDPSQLGKTCRYSLVIPTGKNVTLAKQTVPSWEWVSQESYRESNGPLVYEQKLSFYKIFL